MKVKRTHISALLLDLNSDQIPIQGSRLCGQLCYTSSSLHLALLHGEGRFKLEVLGIYSFIQIYFH